MFNATRLALAVLFLSLVTTPTLAAEVELTTGEVLKGEVTKMDDAAVVVKHPVLGDLTIKRETVAEVRGYEPPADAAEVEPEPAPPPPAKPGQFWLNILPGWESEFIVAFAGASGNSDNANLRVIFRTERDRDQDLTKFDLGGYFAKSGSATTDTSAYAEGYHEWKLTDSKWSIFVDGRYDYDDFKSYQHRVAGHVGVAYRWIEEEDLNVKFLAGVGAVAEFESPNTGVRPELVLGVDVDWKPAENQTLTASARAYPDLDDVGEFRSLSKVEWKMDIDYAKSLALVLGASHEYNSVVTPGADRNDFKYYGGLSLKF